MCNPFQQFSTMRTYYLAAGVEQVWTDGGNAGGAPCVFPFIYKSKSFTECTDVDESRPWCATSGNYAREKEWGFCLGEPKTIKISLTVVLSQYLHISFIELKKIF